LRVSKNDINSQAAGLAGRAASDPPLRVVNVASGTHHICSLLRVLGLKVRHPSPRILQTPVPLSVPLHSATQVNTDAVLLLTPHYPSVGRSASVSSSSKMAGKASPMELRLTTVPSLRTYCMPQSSPVATQVGAVSLVAATMCAQQCLSPC